MAKVKQSNLSQLKSRKHKVEHLRIDLTRKNYTIMGIGIGIIILGYILMAENSVDGFLPTVVAPILLVFGYCVVVPYGIMYKDKIENRREERVQTTDDTVVRSNVENRAPQNISSNIKTGK